MKALALIEPKRVALIEAPEPAGEGSLVSLEASSVNIGDIRGMRDERRSVSHGKAMVYPRLLGFTGVGRVIEPDGSARSRGIMRGQRVVIGGVWGCGTCRWCKAALPNLCDTVHLAGIDDETSGRWRERLRVPGDLLFRIDEAVDYRVAAIVSEIATVNRCVKRSRLEAGDTAAVFGLGAHGLLAVQVLRHYGATQVHGIDPLPAVRQAAMDLGATSVHDPADYPAFLERNPDAAPKRIIQMTSASASMTLALAAVARRGVVSWLGTPDENPVMLPKYYQQMIVKETAVLGSYSKSVQDWVDAVALAEAGAIAVPAGSADIPFGPDPVERLTELARIWPTKNRHYLVFGGAAPATEPRPA